MKRFVAFIGITILLGTVSLGAQAQVIDLAARDAAMHPPLLKEGRLVQLSQKVWDVDTISQSDEVLTQVFVLTNSGDSSLLITRVDACCGCRVIAYPANALEPKESAEMVLMLDLGNLKAGFKRDIWIYASCSDRKPVAHLPVKGYVTKAKGDSPDSFAGQSKRQIKNSTNKLKR